jgi:hypothetical protein
VSPEPATSSQPCGNGAEVEVSSLEQTQAEDATTNVETGTQKELPKTDDNDGHGDYGYESGSPSHDRTSATATTTRRSSSTPMPNKRRSLLLEDSTAMHHRASRVSITASSAPFDATYHPGNKIIFFAPPRQRQRWGDTQILPRLNWGDLFFDLFYVAAAYNVSFAGVLLLCGT